MSAELCRVNLWLEALEPGKPLSFLDHHIRVGNSLLGTTPELIEGGLPDEAFKPLHGDDRDVCSGLRKKNRAERESRQHDMGYLMVAEPRAEYGSLASRSRWIEEIPDDTLERSETEGRTVPGPGHLPPYRQGKRIADAWCAAFVQPRPAGRDPAECITTDTLRGLETDAEALAPTQRDEVERLARDYQFFHWHLAFPEVFEKGGFDCVLGNPPWEHTELKEKEWFAERNPEIANARIGAERKRLIEKLEMNDPLLYTNFVAALRQHDDASHLLRNSGRYPFCGRGRVNFYAVFAEAMRNLVNENGRIGCVLPTGVATDDTTKLFFQDVVRTKSLASLFGFENNGVFFPDVHRDNPFCLFTAGSGVRPTANNAEFVFFALTAEELHDPERRFTLSLQDIALLNPNTCTCPIFHSRKDAELNKAIYRRVPVLIRKDRQDRREENPWGIRFRQGLFNMTSDSNLFYTRDRLEADGWQLVGNVFSKGGIEFQPLYEAKMIHHFDHRWSSYSVEGGKSLSTDVLPLEKRDSNLTVLPRYWVEAREVHLRIADLPERLLSALRVRDNTLILVAVAHLLFANWLQQRFGKSAEVAMKGLFSSWTSFAEHHPFALGLVPTQLGLCGKNPACAEPLGPEYLPAESMDKTNSEPYFRTAWYAAEEAAITNLLYSADRYSHLVDIEPRMHDEGEALDFAEHCLKRASPHWLMGFRDITNRTNRRTVVGGVFPFAAVGNNLPVWTVTAGPAHVFSSLISSLVCDFTARFKVGGKHLNFFIAEQIPVLLPAVFGRPPPWFTGGATLQEWLLPRVLELTFTAWDLEPFARHCTWDGPPFRWDEERRYLLRCELDAAFFHLYLPTEADGAWRPARQAEGCPRNETPEQLGELKRRFPTPRDAVAYILDTFPIVRRKDEESHGEYRTKRGILEIYDAMQASISAGEPYRTQLDPPPADPSCCHPPRTTGSDLLLPADLTELPDGAWNRPGTDPAGDETAVLAAILKAAGGSIPIRRARLATVLALEPRLLTPSLSAEEANQWRRLVGDEAKQLPAGVTRFQPPADYAWGQAVRQHRGSGRLIEDLTARTWAPGTGLDNIQTEGWPDGRAGMAMRVLSRRGDEDVVHTLPDAARGWIDDVAA